MSDIKIKEENHIEEAKEVKKSRKSFIPPELSSYHEKRRKEPNQPLVKSSIGFPSEEYRLMVTRMYKEFGFTTMKSFFMSLVDIATEDEKVKEKLKDKAKILKMR